MTNLADSIDPDVQRGEGAVSTAAAANTAGHLHRCLNVDSVDGLRYCEEQPGPVDTQMRSQAPEMLWPPPSEVCEPDRDEFPRLLIAEDPCRGIRRTRTAKHTLAELTPGTPPVLARLVRP